MPSDEILYEKIGQLEAKLNMLAAALEQKEKLLKRKDEIIVALVAENKKLKGEESESCYAGDNAELISQYIGKK